MKLQRGILSKIDLIEAKMCDTIKNLVTDACTCCVTGLCELLTSIVRRLSMTRSNRSDDIELGLRSYSQYQEESAESNDESEAVFCSDCKRNLGLKKSELSSPDAVLTIRCQK